MTLTWKGFETRKAVSLIFLRWKDYNETATDLGGEPLRGSNKKKKLNILFLAEKSILDKNSGAALELMTWFQYLTEAGHHCYSFSMSCFDGRDEYPVSDLVSKEISLFRDAGRVAELTLGGIKHSLLLTKSTNTMNLKDEDLLTFHRVSKDYMQKVNPDVIVSFGSKYMEPLIRYGKELGARTLFYLATGVYEKENLPALNAAHEVIVPSDNLRSHYRQKLGIRGIKVVPISPNHTMERTSDELLELSRTRKDRFVTMINPSMEKGGLIFINVANKFRSLDSKITFLAVESRGKRTDWDKAGISTSMIPNLWWIPNQASIEHVFRKTSVLLVPSIVHEAAGKVISEALVCGIPVVGSDSGGIPNQMGGSGNIVAIPEEVRMNPNSVPDHHIQTWVDAVSALLDDEERYLKASQKSLQAGQIHRRRMVSKKVVALFEST